MLGKKGGFFASNKDFYLKLSSKVVRICHRHSSQFGGVTPISFIQKQIKLNPKNSDISLEDIQSAVKNLENLGKVKVLENIRFNFNNKYNKFWNKAELQINVEY